MHQLYQREKNSSHNYLLLKLRGNFIMMMGKAIDMGSYDDYLEKEAEKRVFEEISKQERLQNI